MPSSAVAPCIQERTPTQPFWTRKLLPRSHKICQRGSRNWREQSTRCLLNVRPGTQCINQYRVAIIAPHLLNSQCGEDGEFIERKAGEIDLNNQFWPGINQQVDRCFAADLGGVLNVETRVWFKSAG